MVEYNVTFSIYILQKYVYMYAISGGILYANILQHVYTLYKEYDANAAWAPAKKFSSLVDILDIHSWVDK